MLSQIGIFTLILLIQLVAMTNLDHEAFMFLMIFLVAIKEGSYLIWLSTWSQVISRFVPSKMLGRVYSWSYFFGHFLLMISSQIFPRGLTFTIKDAWLTNVLGQWRYLVFFGVLASPILLVIWYVIKIKILAKNEGITF